MSVLKSRLKALEDRQRRAHPPEQEHVTSIVFVPYDVPHKDWDVWLATQPCPCGVVACPDRRIGFLLPEEYPSVEAWNAAAYAHQPQSAAAEREP